MIQTIIVDDHPIIRAGLAKILQSSGQFNVLAEFSDGKDFLIKIKDSDFDLAILDLQMPGVDGLTLIPQIKNNTNAKAVIFTMHEGVGYFREAIQAGVDGYILKTEELKSLPLLLERICFGEFYSSFPLNREKLEEKNFFKISEKEHQILTMLINGLTAKEIGERVGLSKRTVEYYSQKLKEKFDAENVVDLVNRAKDHYYK